MRSRCRRGSAGIAAEAPPPLTAERMKRDHRQRSSPLDRGSLTVPIGERIMTVKERTKPQVATMNAVHDLPVLVARDKGFFKDEGLDLEFVTTPGFFFFSSRRRHTRSDRDWSSDVCSSD